MSGGDALVPYGAKPVTHDAGSSTYTAADATNLKVRPLLPVAMLTANIQQHDRDSPNELIIHESMKKLIAEMADLNERCDRLEANNTELISTIHTLEQAYGNELVRAPLTTANLTGYAFSDAASSGTRSEIENRNDSVDENFAAVGGILNNYDQRFQSLAALLETLEKSVTELTEYKRSTETLFGALKDELNGLSVAEHSQVQAMNSEVTANASDKQEDTVANTVQAVTPTYSINPTTTPLETQVQRLRERQEKCRDFRKATTHKFGHEQIIDGASTKDALYSMFRDIERILISDDGISRRSGPFEGTFGELMLLRDRIIHRLAVYDAYEAAFVEAQTGAKNLA
ncbi:hypothetical protein LTR08_008947 [Meristemomyces frigidus]|nr:hypothetical protein LTR08_008947 [Meristemomyces frigidus]